MPPLLPHFRSDMEAELPDGVSIPPLETPGVCALPSPRADAQAPNLCSCTGSGLGVNVAHGSLILIPFAMS